MAQNLTFARLASYIDVNQVDELTLERNKYYNIHDRITNNGYADFLKDSPSGDTLAQKVMKWNPVVSIYEGRYWRSSRWMANLFGISLHDEMGMIKEIQSLSPDSSVLDLACGPGLYARMFAKVATEGFTIGLDYSPQMLTKAVKLANKEQLINITFMRGDAHKIQIKDKCVHAVHCSGALHLFHDVDKVLSESHRILLPGGKLTVACGRKRRNVKRGFGERALGATTFTSEGIRELFTNAGFNPEIHFRSTTG